jgi:hypothetical protein
MCRIHKQNYKINHTKGGIAMRSYILVLALIVIITTSSIGQWIRLTSQEEKPISITLREDTPNGTIIEFTTSGIFGKL